MSPRSPEPIDPAVEYRRLTGRDAEADALAGVVMAAPRYLNEWIRESALGLLHELDAALTRSPAALTELAVQPVAGWARPALLWWTALRQKGLMWPEAEQAWHIPSVEDLVEILGEPPLRRTCAAFGLARAMHIAGYVIGHGLAHDGFPGFLRDAVLKVFIASGADLHSLDDLDFGSAVLMMEAARSTVEKARKAASRRAPRAGRRMDPVIHAFIRGVQFAREPGQVSGEELALLAAAAGFEPIETGRRVEATKKWSMRLSRLGVLGPVPAPPAGAPPLKTP